MLFDILNIFPYYLHVNDWTGKSVRIFSRKQAISVAMMSIAGYASQYSTVSRELLNVNIDTRSFEMVKIARSQK